MKRPPTCSGRATLVGIDVDALAAGDVLLTPWPTGFCSVVVERVRASVWGDDGGDALPCAVVDVIAFPSGRALVFAPEDLLTVRT